jgi:flagellar capping protein FliD
MTKGNHLPELTLKDTKVPEVDEFFEKASDPMKQLIDWNNSMDDLVKQLREVGSDIRNESSATPPNDLGRLKVAIKDDFVFVTVERNGEPVPPKNLDKVTKEYVSMLEKKAKLLSKRIKTLQKLSKMESATLAINPKKPHQLLIAVDKSALDEHKKDDAVTDMQRSVTKFNDRADLLAMQLKGPITLAEVVSSLIASVKDMLKDKAKELKISIEDGMPKIDGLPESLEDFLPELVAKAWELFNQLIDFLKGLKDQLPELMQKLESLITEAKELPGSLKDAAAKTSLGAMELVKATKALHGNIKTMVSAPIIAKTLLTTMRETGLELASGVTGRVEAHNQAAAGTGTPATKDAPASSEEE